MPDLDKFNADEVKSPEVKPASEVSWEVNATAAINYTNNCILCFASWM